MWTTDLLREEHRWIVRLLRCLERLCANAEHERRLDAGAAAEVLALATHFADGLHQEREERLLFPRLLARARSVEERADIGRLCGDHEEERRALARMNHELLAAVYGEAPSVREFRREATRYAALHREHVLHENRVLLPLAETLLTPEDDERVMQGCVALEHEGSQKLKHVFERIQTLFTNLGLEDSEPVRP
jgi:hemerythrin-like domain-containing protein